MGGFCPNSGPELAPPKRAETNKLRTGLLSISSRKASGTTYDRKAKFLCFTCGRMLLAPDL